MTPASDLPNNEYRLTNDYKGTGQSLEVNSSHTGVKLAASADVSTQYWLISPIQ